MMSSTRPIRVLHLVHWLNRGGIEVWLLDLFRAGDRGQVEMDVCCRGPHTGSLAPEFQKTGATIHHVRHRWSGRSFGRRLEQLLRRCRYDVLHVHGGSFVGRPCAAGRRAGVGTVVTFHSTKFQPETRGRLSSVKTRLRSVYTAWSFRTACDTSDAVVACSQATMDAVLGIARVSPDKRFHVVRLGSGLRPGRDPAARDRIRHELKIDSSAPVVIHVGTMKDPKNHVGLIRIADGIRRAVPNVQLLLVGDGVLRPRIERQIADLNLNGVVRLLGVRDDVDRLLDAADLLLFPSLWEGLPVAVIEAQLKGLPIIGSDIPPLKEVTAENETSLLFPLDREAEMAQAAADLLRDEPRRQAMGAAAMRFAQARFSIAANNERYLEIYRDAMKRAGR